MRKFKRNGIEALRWRLNNQNTPLWAKRLDKAFRDIYRETESNIDYMKKMSNQDIAFYQRPMYFVSPDQYEKVKDLVQHFPEAPPTATFAGVDIAENPLLDHSTIVYGTKRADGSFEILRVDHLDV